MGVYRLYTGSDGESHIEEMKAEVLQNLKVTGTMRLGVQERAPGHFIGFSSSPLSALASGPRGTDDHRALRWHSAYFCPRRCPSDRRHRRQRSHDDLRRWADHYHAGRPQCLAKGRT